MHDASSAVVLCKLRDGSFLIWINLNYGFIWQVALNYFLQLTAHFWDFCIDVFYCFKGLFEEQCNKWELHFYTDTHHSCWDTLWSEFPSGEKMCGNWFYHFCWYLPFSAWSNIDVSLERCQTYSTQRDCRLIFFSVIYFKWGVRISSYLKLI